MVLIMSAMVLMTAGCSTSGSSAPTTQSAAAQRDYDRVSGTWQLTRGVVSGKPVLASVARNTILITDHNTFRFPKGGRRWDASTGNLYCESGYET